MVLTQDGLRGSQGAEFSPRTELIVAVAFQAAGERGRWRYFYSFTNESQTSPECQAQRQCLEMSGRI